MAVVSTSTVHFWVHFAKDYALHYANAGAWKSGNNTWDTGSGEGSGGGGILLDKDSSCSNSFSWTKFTGHIDFFSDYGSSVTFTTSSDFRGRGDSSFDHFINAGEWSGTAPPSTIEIITTATCTTSEGVPSGTYSGHLELWCRGLQHK